ncbi:MULTISPECIES: cytochrome b/b6 domain-containing protein [Carboxydocella]|uniref:Ni/Fe-hydrogenase 1 B-type cytochrome subunit n=2 Tax=Carboxydocella TaxID=178898 RepID=A0A1T4RRA1_9FIRM|nr:MULTISPECIES: cytochrome b/b6 domain-containing protein [Carboxydocella]AVX21882.1 Ni/Fe-hydrogenase 1 B-type cytochrome subunit [Carboxydocella thermautotrophica]AVX32285.1 Ni/Fe-hydrogenase 1 B-type cytochrome subunit [Carboxydocella thermautotrophica]SKA18473.1 Ni/Fe-hydrogenase 1 B-type cytochrome subunit [Carboxydocella sporoproducens DSM 16521]GAW28075.1 Ni/Fe-hydrogenase, b-type cytochrome subunit [Carboxydocella sp. ULO1]GAW32544.1 Ni/Fe-hydrogenase, b-type cytochrome subunit [Carbo
MHPAPVRLVHWWNVTAISFLVLSGFYIHDPLFWEGWFAGMDRARLVHLVAGWLLVAATFYRWGFALVTGEWRQVVFRWQDMKDLRQLLKYYLFLTSSYPQKGKYNPGQKLAYTLLPFLIIGQLVTGVILLKPALAPVAFALGDLARLRLIHYLLTWVMLVFVLGHLYLVLQSGWQNIKTIIRG